MPNSGPSYIPCSIDEALNYYKELEERTSIFKDDDYSRRLFNRSLYEFLKNSSSLIQDLREKNFEISMYRSTRNSSDNIIEYKLIIKETTNENVTKLTEEQIKMFEDFYVYLSNPKILENAKKDLKKQGILVLSYGVFILSILIFLFFIEN